ncbi:MAG: Holliday junction branch migration protein RuvA [Ruminococcaceae bacterium]|nr:Holliday junction branch migration protein RuvA [Oscillospiraceae bacterium]
MFKYITGKVAEKGSNYIVIDVGGVGFMVYTSFSTLQDTSVLLGADATMYTYMYIKEGIMDLYGFSTKEELRLFELLITVSGVGAKGAVAILSVASPSKIALSIISEDVATIKSASGIGAKTAQRIVLELKDKISSESIVEDIDIPHQAEIADTDTVKEATSALVVLGYSQAEARKAVAAVDKSITDVEEIIRQALKKLF